MKGKILYIIIVILSITLITFVKADIQVGQGSNNNWSVVIEQPEALPGISATYASNISLWNVSGSNMYPRSTAWNVGILTSAPTTNLDIGIGGVGTGTGDVFIGRSLQVGAAGDIFGGGITSSASITGNTITDGLCSMSTGSLSCATGAITGEQIGDGKIIITLGNITNAETIKTRFIESVPAVKLVTIKGNLTITNNLSVDNKVYIGDSINVGNYFYSDTSQASFGTTTPTALLEVVGAIPAISGTAFLKINNTEVNSEAGLQVCNDANCWDYYIDASDNFVIKEEGGSNVFTIYPGTPPNAFFFSPSIATINTNGDVMNFSVEGTVTPNLIKVDSGNNAVGFWGNPQHNATVTGYTYDQWSSSNVGAVFYVDGFRNPAYGGESATGNYQWALFRDTSGNLKFFDMPGLGSLAAGTSLLTINVSGSLIVGDDDRVGTSTTSFRYDNNGNVISTNNNILVTSPSLVGINASSITGGDNQIAYSIIGYSQDAGTYGVLGRTNNVPIIANSHYAVYGYQDTANTQDYAGYFEGKVSITGNVTENEYYGEMFYHNHSATSLNFAIANTYYPLFFTNASKLNGFSFVGGFGASSNLTALVGGIYKASYMASGSGQNNHVYYTTILINGNEQDACESHKQMAAGGDVTTMTGSCLIELSASDDVALASMDDGGTGAGDYYSANLNLIRIGN